MTRSHVGLSQCVQLHWIVWWRTQNPVSCAGVADVNCCLWFMQSIELLLWHKLMLCANELCRMIQRVFVAEICTRKKSSINCHRKFRFRFPSVSFTLKWVVYGYANKFWTMGFLLKKKQEWMWGMLSEETSDNDGTYQKHWVVLPCILVWNMKWFTNLMQLSIHLCSFSSTCFGLIRPSSGAMNVTVSLHMQHMVSLV